MRGAFRVNPEEIVRDEPVPVLKERASREDDDCENDPQLKAPVMINEVPVPLEKERFGVVRAEDRVRELPEPVV